MKRVAIYLRVSTTEQSCDLQRDEILRFVEARGWQIHEIYEDKATGTNANRPRLKQMFSDARHRRFEALIIWRLDRLFRSLKHMVDGLQELSELGVEFISLKDNLDLTTSSGRLMMHIVAAFAEFEAAIIRERVVAGIQSARARGKILGRPRTVDQGKVIEMRKAGHTFREISKSLGISSGAITDAIKTAR